MGHDVSGRDGVGGGEAALDVMKSETCDVVVSDMRMPGMDGAALLKAVQQEYPDTVRIVLSGHTELEAALRAIPVAHQFLSKPCDAQTIREVVERACDLQAILTDDAFVESEVFPDSTSAKPLQNTIKHS